MTGLEWDGLRVGDRVLVHDDRTTVDDFPLHPGVVATVNRTTRSHAVGIRIATAGMCSNESGIDSRRTFIGRLLAPWVR